MTEATEGGYDARTLGHGVFTQGEDWDDLKEMVRDAVCCHFADDDVPPRDQIALREGRGRFRMSLPRDFSGRDSVGLKPYPEMRDSGIEWLGSIPEHWRLVRGKNLFRCLDIRSATGEEELLTVSSDQG